MADTGYNREYRLTIPRDDPRFPEAEQQALDLNRASKRANAHFGKNYPPPCDLRADGIWVEVSFIRAFQEVTE